MPRTFVWHPGKGPKQTPRNDVTEGKVEIRQVRSKIGHSWRMRLTLESLGLKHHQDVVIVPDTPSVRGMLNQVRHLVEVTPAAEA